MCEFCNVCVFVYVGLYCEVVCMRGFCNMWVCVCVCVTEFCNLCVCVFVWVS